ncbi:LLM class flavin-dependent oxidoreductase [Acrocarpospora catenulata]|uniref:LLM class flavin-dependent oxidoreductase n=1 Tax=Acrocarpospora catenulata TaxID=2836182 RepID=UPI001BD9AEF1|nr:LLM class flavin-dependent oxidoreductase [Acrocarpospora catenulata]
MPARPPLRFSTATLPCSEHTGEQLDAALDVHVIAGHVRRVERAGFSALIVTDDVATSAEQPDTPVLEPLTLLSALAMLTDKIGLVATVTTEANEPFHVARRLASLDHVSDGRAGWNVDTRCSHREAGGFARDVGGARGDRHERADEFLSVARGLWDSYADDALVADKRSGTYFRPARRRSLDHRGTYYDVAGPLNLSRSPQAYPVLFVTADDEDSIAFAARQADVVLTDARSIDDVLILRTRLDHSHDAAERTQEPVQIWPGVTPVVAPSQEEAVSRREELQAALRGRSQSTSLREHPTGLIIAGTPRQVADRITEWHEAGAADGFAVRFLQTPTDADLFLDGVLPILAQRGVFVPPEGGTLREQLGLPRPNRSAA